MNRFAEFSRHLESYLTREIAKHGAGNAFGSFFAALPNPDPVLRKTGQSISILDEIRREIHVEACSESREAAVTKKKWCIERADASSHAAEVIEKAFKNLLTRNVIREMCEAWGYGYQISEIVWARYGDLFLPEKIIGRSRNLFVFGKDGELRMRETEADFNGTPVPPRKFLLTQHRASCDNPYGEAKYSRCFWPVTFKKGGIKFWAVSTEKFGTPKLFGKLPRALIDTDERDKLLRALIDMVQDACAVIPDDGSVDALETNVTASGDLYERFAHFQNAEISTAILGHSAGATATPGRLGGEDLAVKVRADLVENDSGMVIETMKTLIKYIHELNPSLGQERPEFLLHDEKDIDKDLADRDAKLVGTGQIRFTKKYFTGRYGFREDEIEVVPPHEGVVTPRNVEVVSPQFAAAAPSSLNLTSPIEFQSAVTALADELPDAALQTTIEGVLNPALEVINKADSFDDIVKGLSGLYGKMDTASAQATLEKIMFLGETCGRISNTPQAGA
ncbi:MAG: DUF935 domain-containing protein [Chitinispirillia bacterium]|nr:DUF935 domain-containing protein [Chitinispirillia bacterium]